MMTDEDVSFEQWQNRALEAEERVRKLLAALTPTGETKSSYIGEFAFAKEVVDLNGDPYLINCVVPWDIIKDIMKFIREESEEK
jgi:hypothetical protein